MRNSSDISIVSGINISAEEHVEPAVIPRARSQAYFPSYSTAKPRTQLRAH